MRLREMRSALKQGNDVVWARLYIDVDWRSYIIDARENIEGICSFRAYALAKTKDVLLAAHP